jgi:hypothetical protein
VQNRIFVYFVNWLLFKDLSAWLYLFLNVKSLVVDASLVGSLALNECISGIILLTYQNFIESIYWMGLGFLIFEICCLILKLDLGFYSLILLRLGSFKIMGRVWDLLGHFENVLIWTVVVDNFKMISKLLRFALYVFIQRPLDFWKVFVQNIKI